jgi:ribosomal protein S27E
MRYKNYTVHDFVDMDNVRVSVQCPFCTNKTSVYSDKARWAKWEADLGHVQDIWPEMHKDLREALVSGMCKACWDQMEAATEDDEEEPVFRKAIFNIDDLYGAGIPGYHLGHFWNGWACPLFTREAADQIMAAMPKGMMRYDSISNFYFVRQDDQDYEEPYGAEVHTIDGKEVTLYPIGYECWCWDFENVEDEPANSEGLVTKEGGVTCPKCGNKEEFRYLEDVVSFRDIIGVGDDDGKLIILCEGLYKVYDEDDTGRSARLECRSCLHEFTPIDENGEPVSYDFQ